MLILLFILFLLQIGIKSDKLHTLKIIRQMNVFVVAILWLFIALILLASFIVTRHTSCVILKRMLRFPYLKKYCDSIYWLEL